MAKKWDNIRPCMQTKRRAKRAKRANGQTALVNLVSRERREREREGEREREIAGRLVGTGLVAIVMACAMVPMCQPPQQLSPLLHCC